MYLRISDTHSGLSCHARLLGPLNGWYDIAWIVQTTENTSNIYPLGMLHLIHKLANICWHRIHSQRVETSLKHMGLNTGLMERRRPLAYSLVWILTKEQIDLFERTSVGLDAVKASHSDDGRSHFYQLVYTGLVLARTLPHVAEYETEFYFSFHIFLLP